MRIKVLGCLALVLASSVVASEVSIYKWVDDEGVVHFSHSHPANKEATEVDIQVAYSSSAIDSEKTTEEQKAEDDEENEELRLAQVEKNKKMFEENCQSAQANHKMLSNFKKVLMQDENGNEKLLTGEEITEQLEINKKHLDVYCEPSN